MDNFVPTSSLDPEGFVSVHDKHERSDYGGFALAGELRPRLSRRHGQDGTRTVNRWSACKPRAYALRVTPPAAPSNYLPPTRFRLPGRCSPSGCARTAAD